jgi:two-component system, NarL family, sensor histidine kinase UhpB
MKFIHKYLFGFILIVFMAATIMGQNVYRLDSLEKVMIKAKNDTNKVKTILKISGFYIHNDPLKFLSYASQAFDLSDKLNYNKGRIEGLHAIGGYYYYISRLDSALYYLNKANTIILRTNDKSGLVDSYSNIGSIYNALGNYRQEIEIEINALKICEELKDTVRIANLNTSIGNAFNDLGDYEKALDYCIKGLKLREAINDLNGISDSYLCLGLIYINQKDFDNVLITQFKSLKISEQANDMHMASGSYILIASTYYELGKYGEALSFYEKNLLVSEKVNNPQSIAATYQGMGEVFLAMNDIEKALTFLSKSLKISKEVGDKNGIANSYLITGKIFLKKGDYPISLDYFNKCLSISKETGSKQLISESYKFLSDTYLKMTDYKLAFDNYSMHIQMMDSIHNVETSNKIADLQIKYDVDKKEKEISLLTKEKEIRNKEIQKQKILTNYGIASFLLVIILFIFIYRNFTIRQKLKLETIRNNIAADLHDDIGSTLNSISVFSEVAKQEAGKYIPALEQIGISARQIIESMSDIVWTINPENDEFEKVIIRMRSLAYQLLKAKNIEFVFKADEALNNVTLRMRVRKNLYLLFKEAVNNLVKYSNAGYASFHFSLNNKNIKLIINDNGIGFDTETKFIGNGIKNMKARAAEIGAKFTITSSKGIGTNIELILKI